MLPPKGRRQRIKNPAKKKGINEGQAAAIAEAQMWEREFHPDYDQVMLRISTAATQALRCGSPPGIVS